jgi:hypothetical protein
MVQGKRQMVAVNATSASLHTVCRQRSAERCPPHESRCKAVTASDTPLAKRGEHALLAWGRGGRQMVAAKLRQHHLTRSAASVAQSAARHMTAGARQSLHVTRSWRSAGHMPCSHGAGRKANGGSKATMASLHTVCCQRSAERGPPHDGRREAVTACDTLLAKRGAHALLAWGRVADGWWQ